MRVGRSVDPVIHPPALPFVKSFSGRDLLGSSSSWEHYDATLDNYIEGVGSGRVDGSQRSVGRWPCRREDRCCTARRRVCLQSVSKLFRDTVVSVGHKQQRSSDRTENVTRSCNRIRTVLAPEERSGTHGRSLLVKHVIYKFNETLSR